MALKDHDHGCMHIWTQYCKNRSDGSLDLFNHRSTFIRKFLFIYGSQGRNFYTQNLEAALLSAGYERWLLAESAAAYHATHVDYAPPHISTNWPPEPVILGVRATAPAPQRNATREYGHVAVQPNAPLHRQQILQEVAYQPNAAPHQAPWQNYNATTHQVWQSTPHWWYGNQTGGWEWNPQPGWVATWHWQEG